MTLPELAEVLDTTTAKLRKKAARAGIATTDRTGNYLELPSNAAELLNRPLRDIVPTTNNQSRTERLGVCRLPDTPGMPLVTLGDPMFRDAFTRMRFEREERLRALLRDWRCGRS